MRQILKKLAALYWIVALLCALATTPTQARIYDPASGRFLSRDPLGTVDGPNVYGFCGGDPVNRVDPMGTDWVFLGGNDWVEIAPFGSCPRPPSFYTGRIVGEIYTAKDELGLRFGYSIAMTNGSNRAEALTRMGDPSKTISGITSAALNKFPGSFNGYFYIEWDDNHRQFYPVIGFNAGKSFIEEQSDFVADGIISVTEGTLMGIGIVGDAVDSTMPALVVFDMATQNSNFCPAMAIGEVVECAGRAVSQLKVLGTLVRDAETLRAARGVFRSVQCPIYLETKGLGCSMNMELGGSIVSRIRFRKMFASVNVGEAAPSTLFHYTTESGLSKILKSESLNPSLKALNPNDVRYGNGQYLSDIVPGTKTPGQLSRHFLNIPYQGAKFTHFIEIDVSGLNVVQGRPGVFVVPNETPLNLVGRVINHGSAMGQ